MRQRWPLPRPVGTVSTAIVYLVRGRDAAYREAARRFLASYRDHDAGYAHDLVLVCKGFDDPAGRAAVEADFGSLPSTCLDVDDGSFDLGAYRAAALLLAHRRICFLNSYSEILSPNWLLKLSLNLDDATIGAVGCTGSFEVMRNFPGQPFPNVHLRTNGFLLERELFLDAVGDRPVREKSDAFAIESGPDSMTRRIRARGLDVLVVGADGRGYSPARWPRSRTFRLGSQDNLLIADNQTRAFNAYPWYRRADVVRETWGGALTAVPP